MDAATWAAELARRRAEEAIIRTAFDLRHPTPEQCRRGETRSWYEPPLPTVAPSPGGALERWFLALLDGELGGERVRVMREGDIAAPQLTRRDRHGIAPYATCYGSIVAHGTRWYLLDHVTDGGGPRWRSDRDLVVPASTFAASACPDPVEPPGFTVDRAERERRWRAGWDDNRRKAAGVASPTLPKCLQGKELWPGQSWCQLPRGHAGPCAHAKGSRD
jgi:hypothetical protein